jgi:2-dehydro-3-deoxygalactonokinase
VRGLVAVDWGTSSLRIARMDAQGRVIEERSSAQGILIVPGGDFATVFIAACADWVRADGSFCLMSGMVGSRQGWLEAPYCACPAGFADVAGALAWLMPAPGGARVAIVPGLSCEHDGVPDVMRGEEVQVFGALQVLDLQDATLVLPGTHSKWVTVRGQQIHGFSTFMTGEFYSLLRQHSILSRTLPPEDGALDEAAFDRGVTQALAGGSLLSTAFSVRTLSLMDRMAAQALPSYLSGLVIGEELRASAPAGGMVVVMGAPALAVRYERALAHLGVPTRRVGSEATWRGLWAIAQTLERGTP